MDHSCSENDDVPTEPGHVVCKTSCVVDGVEKWDRNSLILMERSGITLKTFRAFMHVDCRCHPALRMAKPTDNTKGEQHVETYPARRDRP